MTDKTDPSLDAAYDLKSPEDNKALYRDWADTYDEDFASRSGYRFARLIAEEYTREGGDWPVLDAGCGTGLVAEHFPQEAVVDGLDLSADMLAQARAKGRYRHLTEANLLEPLPFDDNCYAGMVSAGTFTHGHVGAEALHGLIRLVRPGGLCVISGNAEFYRKAGFQAVFDGLVAEGMILPPVIRDERIYEPTGAPAAGHEDDMGMVIRFRRA